MATDQHQVRAAGIAPVGVCNICGSSAFKPGPGGRLVHGQAPTCVSCGSLERHRVYRTILHRLLGGGEARDFNALQFSRDPSIEADWFRSLTHSVYGHQNSIDIQAIDLPDAAYDVIICNHIIEHVPDDRAAFQEVSRILSFEGVGFISVPNPAERGSTTDWGYPDWNQHGHYRVYGSDVAQRIASAVPHMWVASVTAVDPVTARKDMGFVLSHSRRWYDKAFEWGAQCQSVNAPV